MTIIKTGSSPVTFINVFTVDPSRMDEFIAHQLRDMHAFVKKMPGLVSTNWHRSLDNTRVANYAQWESVEAFKAAIQNPRFQQHNAEAEALTISHESHFYEVVGTSFDPN